MEQKVDPPQVNHSGTRIPIFSCRDNPYTWYYDRYVHNPRGVAFTIIKQVHYWDHREVSKNNEKIQVAANGTVVLRTRWCSAIPRAHFTQTVYTIAMEGGVDLEYGGLMVPLLAP